MGNLIEVEVGVVEKNIIMKVHYFNNNHTKLHGERERDIYQNRKKNCNNINNKHHQKR
jgi:hypothetical protein